MKILFPLLIFLCVFGCTKMPNQNEKVYYIYDTAKVFKKEQVERMIRFVYRKQNFDMIDDTTKYITGMTVYFLDHYMRDTVFLKQKSFMDSIRYLNSEWFKKDSNLDFFYKKIEGRSTFHPDTFKIYMIEKIENSDSLLFIRVNRDVHWAK